MEDGAAVLAPAVSYDVLRRPKGAAEKVALLSGRSPRESMAEIDKTVLLTPDRCLQTSLRPQ